jgi:hypothetical protein
MLIPFRFCQGANAGEKAGPDRLNKTTFDSKMVFDVVVVHTAYMMP